MRAEPAAGPGPDTPAPLAWSPYERRLVPVPEDHGRRVLDVADSWLVDEGRVRGLRLHAERFTDSCSARHGTDPRATAAFLEAACAALPRRGRWFPRVEFTAGSGFRLRLRTAPHPGGPVAVRVAERPDPRTAPTVKGPDLDLLTGLRNEAARTGADEVLLLSDAGAVLEGALTGILWWRGDVLCAPAAELPVLPSVTRRLLLRLAAEQGVEIRYETCRPEALDGLEVWTVNALHGIRPVVRWAGRAMTPAPPGRAPAWQDALARTARPLGPQSSRRQSPEPQSSRPQSPGRFVPSQEVAARWL